MTNDRTRLILKRRLGEGVFIDGTKVTIDKAPGGGYRFVIEAGREVNIKRSELVEAAK